MSSPSRRSNNDYSVHGSGRSSNSVRRSSSQPPQPFQPPATVSGTRGGIANVPWANRPPSNVQGTAPVQIPAASHLYTNQIQPSGVDWDYDMDVPLDIPLDMAQLIDSTQVQSPPQQQQITVPELYPTTSRGQYENPQNHDRMSTLQQPTTWTGVTHLPPSRATVHSASSLPQSPQDVLYTTQPQYPQSQNRHSQTYPPQRQQQPQQLSSSPPRTRNNQYLDSNRISPPSHLQVSPTMSQMGPLYASQLPSASQHTRTRSSDPDISRLPVAQRPPPSPNRQDVSLRPTRTGNGEGTSDRWGYQPGGASSVSTPPRSSAPQPVVPNIVRQPPPRAPPPQAPQPVPRPPSFVTCLIPDCREQVVRDLRTNELTEYCGEAHMSEAIRRLGILVCPACNKFPRHTGSEYCGYSCEQWAVARERERQQRRQQEQQQQQQRQRQGQQQPQPQQPQQRQGQQPSSVANPYPVPNSGSVTWSNVAGGPTSSTGNSVLSPQVRQGQFRR